MNAPRCAVCAKPRQDARRVVCTGCRKALKAKGLFYCAGCARVLPVFLRSAAGAECKGCHTRRRNRIA